MASSSVLRLAPTNGPRPEGAKPSLYERLMVCNGCGEKIRVCGKVSDLEPLGWRCVRCRAPLGLWVVSAQERRAKAGGGTS